MQNPYLPSYTYTVLRLPYFYGFFWSLQQKVVLAMQCSDTKLSTTLIAL